jgi:hypothetical protein
MRRLACVFVLAISSLAVVNPPQHATKSPAAPPPPPASSFVPPPCALPFDAIKVQHPIDTRCGTQGTGAAAFQLQNKAKNNFCATGMPAPVTFAHLTDLQHRVEAPPPTGLGPNYTEPASRTMLTALGEGTPAAIIAFIREAHFADTGSGEGVNCDLKGEDNNDIHIALVEQAGADECTSITAEMSPHFRPQVWAAATPDPKSTQAKPLPAIPRLNDIARPVLITGQLFFDAHHHPCVNGHPKTGDPSRKSSWEIHPVYSIRVCKHTTITACNANVPADWEELDAVIHP